MKKSLIIILLGLILLFTGCVAEGTIQDKIKAEVTGMVIQIERVSDYGSAVTLDNGERYKIQLAGRLHFSLGEIYIFGLDKNDYIISVRIP